MCKNDVLLKLNNAYICKLNSIRDLMCEAIGLRRKIERIEFLRGVSRGFSLKGVK